MTKTIRKIVKTVLAENGKTNKFSVALWTAGWEGGKQYYAVTIKDWTPDPSASTIKASIKDRCNLSTIGVLVSFDGIGFVQS